MDARKSYQQPQTIPIVWTKQISQRILINLRILLLI